MDCSGFLKQIGAVPERSDAWHSLEAALLTTQVAVASFVGLAPNRDGLMVVRRAIRPVSDNHEHQILDRIIDQSQLVASGEETSDVLDALLLGHSVTLHDRGFLWAAANVCSALVESPVAEAPIRLSARGRRAFAMRLLGEWGASAVDYAAMIGDAAVMGDRIMQRKGELGMARLTAERGNFPAAAIEMDAILVRARQAEDREILAETYIARAGCAGRMRDFGAALRYSTMALEYIDETWQREDCYINMAQSSRDLGEPERASQYAALVREAGTSADRRARGGLILYLLAIDARSVAGQRTARAWLDAADLPPRIACEYREAMSYAYAMGDKFRDAVRVTEELMALAEQHRIPDLYFSAEAALPDLRRGRIPLAFYSSGVIAPKRRISPPARAGLTLLAR